MFIRLIKSLTVLAVLISLLGGVTLYASYHYFARDLPDLSKITGYRPALDTEVYSYDGRLIGEFYTERRKLFPIEELPGHVIDAFISIEDQRFFEHQGFDLRRIIAAFIVNMREGKIVQGASTITQQVVKNLIFTSERKYTRKIKEAILSYEMEKNLSKDEILYIYLNHIYFGSNSYGIEAASQNFFGKSASDINIAEAALLASLPKAPEKYSLRRHLHRAINRRTLILKAMRKQKKITHEELIEAMDYEIKILPRKDLNPRFAPYFIEAVRQHLENKVGTRAFLQGGYKIFTTLDAEMNLAAQWGLRRNILDLEKRQGRGFYTQHLKTGKDIRRFLADQKIGDLSVGSSYNAVVQKIQKSKQPQNTKKHLLYTATVGIGASTATLNLVLSEPWGVAVEILEDNISTNFAPVDGYNDWSLVPKLPTVGDVMRVSIVSSFDDGYRARADYHPKSQGAVFAMEQNGFIKSVVGGFDFSKSQFNRAIQARRQPGSAFKPILYSAAIDKGYNETSIVYDIPILIQDWAPKNYDESLMGAITLRKAMAKSRNLASVRLIMEIDPAYTVEYASKFGFTSKLNPYPSLALGGSDLTLIEMVRAYNTFAAGGISVEPTMILRIYDRDGKIIEDNSMYKPRPSLTQEKLERDRKRLDIIEQISRSQRAKLEEGYPRKDLLVEKDLTPQNPLNFDQIDHPVDERIFVTPEEFLSLLETEPENIENSRKGRDAIDEETAYIMVDMLKAAINEGTGRRARWLNNLAPIAGKTGTTNNFTDAWFIGFSPRITSGVWVGIDNHTTLGNKESGSRAALPIWIDFMSFALKKYGRGYYTIPEGIHFVNTPYGFIPFKTDSLYNAEEIEYLESSYGGPSGDELDFILRR